MKTWPVSILPVYPPINLPMYSPNDIGEFLLPISYHEDLQTLFSKSLWFAVFTYKSGRVNFRNKFSAL